MYSTYLGENRNCIKINPKFSGGKEYNQYDSYGNIVFTYKKSTEFSGNPKYTVYDIDKRIIGSIEKQIFCTNKNLYFLYDENNKLLNIIESIDSCMFGDTYYNFYDSEKNIENILVLKKECCSIKYELYDKYNSLINRAELITKFIGKNYYCEYDANDSDKVFKIELSPFKIYENNNEVDLAYKNFFNNGFSKFQMYLILNFILFYCPNPNTTTSY